MDLMDTQFESNRKMVSALRAENAELKDMIIHLQSFTGSLHKLVHSLLEKQVEVPLANESSAHGASFNEVPLTEVFTNEEESADAFVPLVSPKDPSYGVEVVYDTNVFSTL
jgi:hypothetical protein